MAGRVENVSPSDAVSKTALRALKILFGKNHGESCGPPFSSREATFCRDQVVADLKVSVPMKILQDLLPDDMIFLEKTLLYFFLNTND